MGNKTGKVLRVEMVTRSKEPVAQKHERLGTETIYQYLQQKGVTVSMHCHDNNASITKYVRENHSHTVNQLDNWHACKSFQKHISSVTQGPRYKHCKTWHFELADKLPGMKVHLQYALHNCKEDAGTLRSILLNAVEHYKGYHEHCSMESRCKKETTLYHPTKVLIVEEKAESLLVEAIKTSHVYRNADLYRKNASTAHVESFNNTLNVFQDKRICFSDKIYKLRSNLAICHWNENLQLPEGQYSYNYRENIFSKFIDLLYSGS